MKSLIPVVVAILLVVGHASVANCQGRWQRRTVPLELDLQLFHSTQAFALPTAETWQRGLFQFEISHRFLPLLSDGVDALWGLDGPVNMRLGLGYAISDRLATTLARSNVSDNTDLQLKYRVLQIRSHPFPILIGFQAGAAWNTEVPGRDSGDSRNFQYYGQVIVNTMVGDRFALGLVPSYLYNIAIESEEIEQMLTLGIYGQYYVTKLLSFLGEWNITEASLYYKYDAVAFGIELETGGHFFKISVTNSVSLNPSQYLAGTNTRFEPDQWRLGFNITRILRF